MLTSQLAFGHVLFVLMQRIHRQHQTVSWEDDNCCRQLRLLCWEQPFPCPDFPFFLPSVAGQSVWELTEGRDLGLITTGLS